MKGIESAIVLDLRLTWLLEPDMNGSIYTHKFSSQKTCLSSGVLSLCCLGITSAKHDALTPNGTLNWEHMKALFAKKDNAVVKDADWYKTYIARLAPVVTHVNDIFQVLTPLSFSNKYTEFLLWTHDHKIFLRSFELLQCDDVVTVPLAMLLQTACLERALGNVCLIKGCQVPSLLKDLLSLPYLSELFGSEVVQTLQIIMGPSFSLNLRNLLWHGFFAPPELDKRYAYFLLIISISLGERLAMKSISTAEIPFREATTFTPTSIWEGTFPCIEDGNIYVLKEIFFQSSLVLPQMRPYWEHALKKYMEKKYGESLALILPQLENCLRVLFVSINDCPSRLLTAESTILYTTFDEILEEFVDVNQNQKNLVRDILGDNNMELLFDMLIHPEGPRIRDHLSHGEVDFCDIPCTLSTFVLSSAAAICFKFVPEKRIFIQDEYVKKLMDCLSAYQSKFHSTSLLQKKIVSFITCLTEWHLCPFPEEDHGNFPVCSSSHQLLTCLEAIFHYYQLEYLGNRLTYCVETLTRVEDFIKQWHPQTIYRPRVETEVTTLLRKIAQHAFVAAEHVYKALCFRYELWIARKLRSRQRANYMRLLNSKETMGCGLFVVLLIVIAHCHELNRVSFLSSEAKNKMIRLLKGVLQYVENVDSMTDPDRNRWEESCKITIDFFLTITNYCKNSLFL